MKQAGPVHASMAVLARADVIRVRSRRPRPRPDRERVGRRDRGRNAARAGVAVLRLRRGQLHDRPRRQSAARRHRRRAHRARARAQSLPAQHRRRHPGAEVGLDQRLHRGRRREPGLRLDADRRDHGHHHRGAARFRSSSSASCPRRCRRTRPLTATPAPSCSTAGASIPPTDYTKWAGLIRAWATHANERYPNVAAQLAVGAVERTRHRLLARHVRRVREALRLHGSGAARR